MHMLKQFLVLLFLFFVLFCNAQTLSWVDSMDNYAREAYLPAKQYQWTWQNAALLKVMVNEYEAATPERKSTYFDYVKKAMDKNKAVANGRKPNNVASGLGMAFLYRITKDEKYKKICDKIFSDYMKTPRTKDGAVSHIPLFTELWDDTVFMIGAFLLEMYRATGDEKYIDELAKQMALHRDKLQVKEWGMWVHGWDQSDWGHCMFCSQIHWSDKHTHRSPEIWGRGNGWIVVTLSDALSVIPKSNAHYTQFSGYLKEMVVHLPELQDKQTGHWYQLPVRKGETGNYIESSCTAMFAYGIQHALQLGLVNGDSYKEAAMLAYKGLREYSVVPVCDGYLTSKNVCKATCIGDKSYYFKRGTQKGKAYGLASFIQFGRLYEK
jgi:unsaturated rhamnogalacturonyl hydrolase